MTCIRNWLQPSLCASLLIKICRLEKPLNQERDILPAHKSVKFLLYCLLLLNHGQLEKFSIVGKDMF